MPPIPTSTPPFFFSFLGVAVFLQVDDTVRNPALRKPDGSFAPAYALTDWSLERAGRVDKAHASTLADAAAVVGAGAVAAAADEEAAAAGEFAGSLGSCEVGSGALSLPEAGGRKGSDRQLRAARTAGLVVIGDEILAAQTADSNSAFAIRRLRDDGVALKRVVIVSDDFDAIRDEVSVAKTPNLKD